MELNMIKDKHNWMINVGTIYIHLPEEYETMKCG